MTSDNQFVDTVLATFWVLDPLYSAIRWWLQTTHSDNLPILRFKSLVVTSDNQFVDTVLATFWVLDPLYSAIRWWLRITLSDTLLILCFKSLVVISTILSLGSRYSGHVAKITLKGKLTKEKRETEQCFILAT